MNTFKFTFLILTLFLCVTCGVFVSNGFFEPQIGLTVMDGTSFPASDEAMVLKMSALPFQVDVPDFWSFNEDETSYWVSYHEGLEGTLRFYKAPYVETLQDGRSYDLADSGVQLNCTARFCEISSSTFNERYRVSLDEREMHLENSEKMWRALRSIRLD